MTHKSHDPEQQERVALFAGTFDPFTTGHYSIVERGLRLFDRIVVAVGVNGGKCPPATAAARVDAISRVFARDSRVSVIAYDGLTVEAAEAAGARFLLRGVRSVADYEYERALADINRNISGIETVILYALPELAVVSSSMVRELDRYGRDVSPYLPPAATDELN